VWTKENFKEFRKLKRQGFTLTELEEYFGEKIYESGLVNKKSSLLGFLDYINEIKIYPEEILYHVEINNSIISKTNKDYILSFNCDNIRYVIILMYFKINKYDTYNVIFTTDTQYKKYIDELNNIFLNKNGMVNDKDRKKLENILESETNNNHLISLMKKLSYVIIDFYKNNISNYYLSIGETKNPIKIKLYKNIINNSFNFVEQKIKDSSGNVYWIYS
jgi:hypothetical protein